jgi:hypothetical protein
MSRKCRDRPGRPYDVRHSFASLLLHEGRDVIYVARQLGHGAELTLRTYGHVIEELEDSPQLPAEEAIRRARQAAARGGVYRFVALSQVAATPRMSDPPSLSSAPSRIRTCGLLLRRLGLGARRGQRQLAESDGNAEFPSTVERRCDRWILAHEPTVNPRAAAPRPAEPD